MTTPTEAERHQFHQDAMRMARKFKRDKKAWIKCMADIGLMTHDGNLTEWGKNVAWLIRSGQQKDPFTLSDRD